MLIDSVRTVIRLKEKNMRISKHVKEVKHHCDNDFDLSNVALIEWINEQRKGKKGKPLF